MDLSEREGVVGGIFDRDILAMGSLDFLKGAKLPDPGNRLKGRDHPKAKDEEEDQVSKEQRARRSP
jgi:hypothetical protein